MHALPRWQAHCHGRTEAARAPLCRHSQLAQHSQMQHGHVEVGGGLRRALNGTIQLLRGISRGQRGPALAAMLRQVAAAKQGTGHPSSHRYSTCLQRVAAAS